MMIGYGLAAALCWGTGDFAGGLASRQAAAIRVILFSQAIGALALVAYGLLTGEPAPSLHGLAWGAVAGLAGAVGIILLYKSLAQGKMGIAAPLTGVAAGGLPVLVGVALEGLPGVVQIAGFALALLSIIIVSDIGETTGLSPKDLVMPLLSGVGFGVFITIMGLIGDTEGFVWPVVAGRVSAMLIYPFIIWRTSDPLDGMPIPWGLTAVAGLGDTAGNAFLVLSASAGRLDIASVLAALYPAVTALLARIILHERLTRRQALGVVLALVAIGLIAL